LASTFSNVDHIKAIQKDVMTFLHTYYPWLMTSDVFEQLETTTLLMKEIKDLNITQVAQAGKIIEELLYWDEYPSLSEDEAAGPTLMESTTCRVRYSGAWEHGALATHPKPQHKFLKHTGPLKKKAKASATEVCSDSELSNSVDSYSTRRSRCRIAKCSQEPAMTSPSVALKLP
jgi:hypothetical protein